jgi:hypothetical protein
LDFSVNLTFSIKSYSLRVNIIDLSHFSLTQILQIGRQRVKIINLSHFSLTQILQTGRQRVKIINLSHFSLTQILQIGRQRVNIWSRIPLLKLLFDETSGNQRSIFLIILIICLASIFPSSLSHVITKLSQRIISAF